MSDNEIVIGGDSADIPPATYNGRLFALTTKTSDAYGDFRAWDFQIRKPNGEVVIVGGASSMNTGAKSKGGKWLAALLGRKLIPGEAVNPVGNLCMVVVEEVDGWPKVTDVLPPMAAQAPTPEPAPVAAGRNDLDDLPF